MSVTFDILRAWRAPRVVMRARLAAGVREDRAIVILMVACALIFVSQWPGAARGAYEDPSVPLDARLAGALMASMFLAPLFFYALGAFSHLVARVFGGRGSFYGARLALFWSLLVISPLMLFQGLVTGFIGPGPVQTLMGLFTLGAFLVIWMASLREAELEPFIATA